MEKDVSPFLDQDVICNDVARTPYRSKLDMLEVYEQICIVPEDVHKTTFATIFGTKALNRYLPVIPTTRPMGIY